MEIVFTDLILFIDRNRIKRFLENIFLAFPAIMFQIFYRYKYLKEIGFKILVKPKAMKSSIISWSWRSLHFTSMTKPKNCKASKAYDIFAKSKITANIIIINQIH